jgi:hypothetical protein
MIMRTWGGSARHDGSLMVRVRRGRVLRIVGERPGAIEVEVELDGAAQRALAYPAIVGAVRPGDHVVLNTTAVALGLGTGGWHFVMAVEGAEAGGATRVERLMKVRYTPSQVAVPAVEDGDLGASLSRVDTIDHAPVVWIPLHSMLGPVVAGARLAGARSVAYVMTDGAALAAPFSRLSRRLRDSGLLDGVVSCGQAFGGDLEAVNPFSGLLTARHINGAEVIVIGDGPGNTGTQSRWGASNVWSAMALNAAAIMAGRPVATLRVSFADPRPQHRGVSHHTVTALSRVVLSAVHVAVPALEDDAERRAVWDALRAARLEERHQLVEVNGRPAMDLLEREGVPSASMGRTPADDPAFFLAAGAAGILAGRMAVGARSWRPTQDSGADRRSSPSRES